MRLSVECVNPFHNIGLDPDSRYDEVIHGNGISLRTISMKGRSMAEELVDWRRRNVTVREV